MINARAETLSEKPSFKNAFRYRRCLVLADGFYEWVAEPGTKSKTPMYIHLKNKRPFAFAGLWESWNPPDGSELLSCTIITTEPNPLVAKLHNRMPVILHESDYPLWLQTDEVELFELQSVLGPYPAEEMSYYPVSKQVNNPANESPDCIKPLA